MTSVLAMIVGFYFVPMIICILIAKRQKDTELIELAFAPLFNICCLLVIIFEPLNEKLKDWIEK